MPTTVFHFTLECCIAMVMSIDWYVKGIDGFSIGRNGSLTLLPGVTVHVSLQ